IPLAAVLLTLAGVGLASRRIAATDRAVAAARAVLARSSPSLRTRWRLAASVVLAIGWFIALTISFDRNPALRGSSLFSLAQWRAYAAAWLTPVTVAAAAYCLGAGVALVAAVRRGLRDRWPAVGDLAMGAWCGIPLVLLVIGVGEPPRNYIAEIGIVIALASCGWTWLAAHVAARSRSLDGAAIDPRLASVARMLLSALTGAALGFAVAFATRVVTFRLATVAGAVTGAAVGLAWLGLQWRVRRRAEGAPGATADVPRGFRRRGSAAAAALLISTLVATSTVLADHVRTYRGSATGGAQAAAVQAVTDWIDTNVPPNTSIAFGSFLGYQMGLSFDHPYRLNQIAQVIARFRANAPLGIGIYGYPPADDWVAVDAAPRNVAEFQAFQSSTVAARFRTTGARYWIVNTGTSTSAPTILAAIDPDDGLTLVASWDFPYTRRGSAAPGYLHSFIYRVDASTVSIDPGRLFIAPDALDGLVSQLEAGPQGDARAIAARLLDRVVISPTGPGDAALLDRLRRLAGR
ncbi:MAG TPA: hypothetical protein VE640_00780, partial [Candidatus Bathyarchaeia archaeon]|nr:hypothetical protein [Candidatus Bathyarchaeia archaeon]